MRLVLGMLFALFPNLCLADVMILECDSASADKHTFVAYKIDGTNVEAISADTSKLVRTTRRLSPDGVLIVNSYQLRSEELVSATTLTPMPEDTDHYIGRSYFPQNGEISEFSCERATSLESSVKSEVLKAVQQLDQFSDPEILVAAFALSLKPKPEMDLNKVRDVIAHKVVRCWNVGSLRGEAIRAKVSVSFTLNETGIPIVESIADLNLDPTEAEKHAFEVLRRAIIRCGAAGEFKPDSLEGQLEVTLSADNYMIKALHE